MGHFCCPSQLIQEAAISVSVLTLSGAVAVSTAVSWLPPTGMEGVHSFSGPLGSSHEF
jgi:hypothetical protein